MLRVEHPVSQPWVRIRTVAAFVLAPLVPGALFALPDLLKSNPMAAWYIEFSAIVGYPIMLLVGIPLYVLSRRTKYASLSWYVLYGALMGVVAYFAALVPALFKGGPGIKYALATTEVFVIISAACGLVALVAFWLIARPDRS